MLNRESTIQILYSETSGVTPDSTLLKDGELAINAADEKLFFKGSDAPFTQDDIWIAFTKDVFGAV